MNKVLSAENCSGGDTQQPAAAAESFSQAACQSINNPPSKPLCLPSVSLLNTVVNKEVEQQFSGRGMTL
jgi:hypothetical protein